MVTRARLGGAARGIAGLLLAGLLAGCGFKGPLYLPAKPKAKVPAAATAPSAAAPSATVPSAAAPSSASPPQSQSPR